MKNNMEYKILDERNDIALIMSNELVLKNVQSALDLISVIQYEVDCDKMILTKAYVVDDFFV